MSNVDYSLLVQLLDADAACGYVLYRALHILILWTPILHPDNRFWQYSFGILANSVRYIGSYGLQLLCNYACTLVCVCVRCGSDVCLIVTMYGRFSRNSYTSTVIYSWDHCSSYTCT
jgi:hypothetical protein